MSKIGNSKEIPAARSKYIINFIYSEYLDSNSKFNPDCKKFSKEIKNDQIIGINKQYANNTPKKNKIGTIKIIGRKKDFSFLYIAGEINSTNWITMKGKVIMKEANKEIFKFDKKTSGRPVNIILFLSGSSRRTKRGLDNNSPTYDAL